MRQFLISYFYQGGQGRSFVTSPADRVVTSSVVEEWEAQIEKASGLSKVGITSFQELEGPAEAVQA